MNHFLGLSWDAAFFGSVGSETQDTGSFADTEVVSLHGGDLVMEKLHHPGDLQVQVCVFRSICSGLTILRVVQELF